MNEFIVKIMLFIRQIINCLNLLKTIQKCIYLSKTQTVKLPACSSNYIQRPYINPLIDYKIT